MKALRSSERSVTIYHPEERSFINSYVLAFKANGYFTNRFSIKILQWCSHCSHTLYMDLTTNRDLSLCTINWLAFIADVECLLHGRN